MFKLSFKMKEIIQSYAQLLLNKKELFHQREKGLLKEQTIKFNHQLDQIHQFKGIISHDNTNFMWINKFGHAYFY